MWPFEISSLRRLRNKKEINKLKLSGHRHRRAVTVVVSNHSHRHRRRRHRQNCEIRIIHSKQFQFVCILLEVAWATYGFVDVDEMIICFPIVCYLFLVKSSWVFSQQINFNETNLRSIPIAIVLAGCTRCVCAHGNVVWRQKWKQLERNANANNSQLDAKQQQPQPHQQQQPQRLKHFDGRSVCEWIHSSRRLFNSSVSSFAVLSHAHCTVHYTLLLHKEHMTDQFITQSILIAYCQRTEPPFSVRFIYLNCASIVFVCAEALCVELDCGIVESFAARCICTYTTRNDKWTTMNDDDGVGDVRNRNAISAENKSKIIIFLFLSRLCDCGCDCVCVCWVSGNANRIYCIAHIRLCFVSFENVVWVNRRIASE